MSTRRGSVTKGPPKHQNLHAWKPNSGVKRKDKELGGKSHPYPAVTGVCNRCKEQIEWRRKYGKYKPLTEPAKCNQCSKRAVRQAYHTLCTACAEQRKVCAKCCHASETRVGRICGEEEDEAKEGDFGDEQTPSVSGSDLEEEERDEKNYSGCSNG